MKINWRAPFFLLFTFSLFLLAVSFILQYVFKLSPCPFCIIDRILILILVVIFGIAAWHNPLKRSIQVFYSSVGLIFVTLGIMMSAWHLRLLHLPANQIPECTPSLNYLLQTFPFTEVLSIILHSSGQCATQTYAFLGLSIPGWTLIGFVLLGMGIFGSYLYKR